jgi:hypothetical protein
MTTAYKRWKEQYDRWKFFKKPHYHHYVLVWRDGTRTSVNLEVVRGRYEDILLLYHRYDPTGKMPLLLTIEEGDE